MKVITIEEFKKMYITECKMLAYGGLWENNEIEVRYDYPIAIYEDEECNCPHLGERYIVRGKKSNGDNFDNIYANCPRVIVAFNEGNCNSTGVCYDCIKEAMETE
jgi:hypothetical protein